MIYSIVGNWRSRLYLFFFGIGLVMLFLPWFFKGGQWMPGKALQEIRLRYCLPAQLKEFPAVVPNNNLADAAAWEFEQSNIPSVGEAATFTPVYSIEFADSGASTAIFQMDGIALHRLPLSPETQLFKDLTK